jgi:hypothetical protein
MAKPFGQDFFVEFAGTTMHIDFAFGGLDEVLPVHRSRGVMCQDEDHSACYDKSNTL